MNIALVAGAALLVGAAFGYLVNLRTIIVLRRRLRELRGRAATKAPTETMKRIVWACVANGFAWVWCSYILAALDKPQIAEELSKVALIEIVAPVAVYAGKSVLENLSKNNHWPDKAATDSNSEPGEPPDEGQQEGEYL